MQPTALSNRPLRAAFFYLRPKSMQRRSILALAALAASGFSAPCRAARAELLGFDEMYGPASVLGITFSEKLKSLAGKRTAVRGFMAPPLKAGASFLVLTRSPVNLCPFCNSDEDWPDSILVVYLKDPTDFVQANEPIEVEGTLQLGSATDPETGFVSLVRLVEADWRRLEI